MEIEEGMMLTGKFTKVVVDKREVGQQLRATLGYYALNTSAFYWKTFLVATCPGRLRQMISGTRELGQEGRGEHMYDLGDTTHGRLYQPDREITITFALFGHNDAGYNWNWQDYDDWRQGIPNPRAAQPLASAEVSIGPKASGAPSAPVEPGIEYVYNPPEFNEPPEAVVQPVPISVTLPSPDVVYSPWEPISPSPAAVGNGTKPETFMEKLGIPGWGLAALAVGVVILILPGSGSKEK